MNNKIEVLIEKYIGNKEIYQVPMRVKKKEKKLNPETNRMKNFKKNRYLETTIPPEERTLENIPKYADGSSKVRFQDWLELEKSPELWPKLRNVSWGWGKNKCVYGWSHRAIGEFYKGKKVRRDSIGNDRNKEFTLESDEEAEEMAKKFAREVS